MRRWQELKTDARLRANLEKRAGLVSATREFFDGRGYLEVETPILVARPGMEPYLDPFETETRDPSGNRFRSFLITSPEYAMKKLLVAGFPKIYQMVKCFRNSEEFGGLHNPEFTMLEWYRAGADYRVIMDETEALVASVARSINGKTVLNRMGGELDLAAPWERLSVKEAFARYAEMDLDAALADERVMFTAAESEGHRLPAGARFEDAFFAVFLNRIEPKLGTGKPTFLYDYPVSMASLSRASKANPRYAERFELYIGGLELANAFTELTDATEQRKRLEEERELRRALGKADYSADEDFLTALEAGMPEAGGIALGIDRLAMVLLGETDIRRVTSFPADSMFGSSQNGG